MRSEADPIVKELADRRKALGMRQADLARRLKVGQTTLSELENHGVNPTLKVLQAYAEAVGAKVVVVDVGAEA